MTKVLTEKDVEYRVSHISGSQALSGIVVTDERNFEKGYKWKNIFRYRYYIYKTQIHE